MIKFGPSGNSESFYNEGHKSTVEAPKWVKERGLDIYEYSFGKGVLMGENTAKLIGAEAQKYDVEITAHAPYFINFANPDDEKGEKNGFNYLLDSMRILGFMGGNRVVFHSGTETKQKREVALENIIKRLTIFKDVKKSEGYENFIICPETMGKFAQIGDLDEIIRISNIDESYYPCIDFGHLNARGLGSLNEYADIPYEFVVLPAIE